MLSHIAFQQFASEKKKPYILPRLPHQLLQLSHRLNDWNGTGYPPHISNIIGVFFSQWYRLYTRNAEI